MENASALAALCALCLPWALCAHRLLGPRGGVGTAAALPAAVGTASAVAALRASAAILDFHAAVPASMALSAAALAASLWLRPCEGTAPPAAACPTWAAALAWAILGALALALAFPLLVRPYPAGWDPAFHCVLIKKILDGDALPRDWTPFEDIPVSYPLGLHVLQAAACRLSGVPPHAAFQASMLLSQATAAALVAEAAGRVFRNPLAIPLSVAAYGVLPRLGGLFSFPGWGGAPSSFGFMWTLAWACLLLRSGGWTSWRAPACCGILLAATAEAHHLSAAIAAVCAAGWCAGVWLLRRGRRVPHPLPRRVLLSAGAACPAALPLLPELTRALAGQAHSHAFRFAEEARTPLLEIPGVLGHALSALAAAGLLHAWLRRAGAPRWRVAFLGGWLCALLAAFVALDDLYRGVVRLVAGEDVTALVPSRFLTAAAIPLSLFAGHACATAFGLLGRAAATPRTPAALAAGACAAAALLGAKEAASLLSADSPDDETARVAAWVRANTPPNSLVLYPDGLPAPHWMPYMSWRATLHSPIPASEARGLLAEKFAAFHSAPASGRMAAWLDRRGLQCYKIIPTAGGRLRLVRIR